MGKIGSAIGRLGTKVFRLIGRHSGDAMQSNKDYLDLLKTRGIVNSLDGILARRANPVIVAKRKGWTEELSGTMAAQFSLGASFAQISGEISGQYQRDFKVSGHTYAPIVQNIRNADRETLMNLRRPQPDGVTMLQLPYGAMATELSDMYDQIIEVVEQTPPTNSEDWADFAN